MSLFSGFRAVVRKLPGSALCIALTLASLPAQAQTNVMNGHSGQPFMEEAFTAPESTTAFQTDLYSAYACVYHHNYREAGRWLMYATIKSGTDLVKCRLDPSYLLQSLNSVAAKQKHAHIVESSPEFQILRALLQADGQEALSMLKRVALNNPTYPSLKYLNAKIKTYELELSEHSWDLPADVVQRGVSSRSDSKWRSDRLPLKVYIPPDAISAKVAGYKPGDGQLMRTAFDTWQKQTGGKVKFVYVPAKDKADIVCGWVSDPKELMLDDVIGLCIRTSQSANSLSNAEIRVLTYSGTRLSEPGPTDSSRRQTLQEVCLHEIGHAVGLNHSSAETDVMTAHAHWHPITILTARDLAAFNSLYSTNVNELINEGLAYIRHSAFKQAVAPLEKAIALNPADSQSRDTLCICLARLANGLSREGDSVTANKLASSAVAMVAKSQSARAKEAVQKSLHYVYLKDDKFEKAEQLEKLHSSLQPAKNSASFLDKYGMTYEALPHYEKALATAPDDMHIREKFCYLLVTLAKDEMTANHDVEAIRLLTRAKGMLVKGIPKEIVDKVYDVLRQAYLRNEQSDDAIEVEKERRRF